MLLSTHVLAGIVISQHAPNPFWAFLISLVSHYILDIIPHGDQNIIEWIKRGPKKPRMFLFLATDLSLLFIFLVTVYLKTQLPAPKILLAAIVGSSLPDLLYFGHEYFYKKYLYHKKTLRNILRKYLQFERILDHNYKLHDFLHELLHVNVSLKFGALIQLVIIILLLYICLKIS